MGPRPEGHGENNKKEIILSLFQASMGPRPEGHGELEHVT